MMRRLAIAHFVLIALANTAHGQRITEAGPDPRGRGVRPFNPTWGVLVIHILQIETAVTEEMAARIDRLRATLAGETDDARRKSMEDRLVRLTTQGMESADWIVSGLSVGRNSDGGAFDFGETSLRVSKRHHDRLRHLHVGDFLAATNPHAEPDGTWTATASVEEIFRPGWWRDQVPTGFIPQILPPVPKVVHPILRKTDAHQYPFHPPPLGAAETVIADVVARTLPAVFTIVGSNGGGTGFVISEGGIGLTNQHVVDEDREFVARFVDGRTVHGTVVGVPETPNLDLAIVDLDGDGYPFIPLGTSTDLQLGEDVVVIGAPQGMEHTVTGGIVGGLRDIDGVRHVQTDAAANPGNSGGPLIRTTGVAVGVIAWTMRDAEGLTFAIAIDEAIDRLPLIPEGAGEP